jgi:Fe2+ or Zn2+ uptake regulation protein
MSSVANIILELKNKGYKNSFLRSQILDYLFSSNKPLSARQILSKLAENNLKPNKTTIYRELEMLTKEGILGEIKALESSKLYELTSTEIGHHHHLVCTSCEDIQCVKIPENLATIQKDIQKNQSFEIERHIMEFFGKCSNCRLNQI